MTPRARPGPWWGVVIADVALEAVREGIRIWRDYRRPPPRRPPEKPATMTNRDLLRRIAIDELRLLSEAAEEVEDRELVNLLRHTIDKLEPLPTLAREAPETE